MKIEKLPQEEGKNVKFETLLIASTDASDLQVGKPSLGEKVEAKIIEQGKDKKITVVKYKNKTRYKKTTGHRQAFSKVEISKIA